MPHVDDRRLALASRAIRRKRGLTQIEATKDGLSRRFVLSLEAGRAGELRVGDVRDYFTRLGASVRLSVYWNGAQLDRLIDERHAAVGETAIATLRAAGWATMSEVTFSEFGERGSIDVLAVNESAKAAFVGEFKSEWGSLEETNRSLDIKTRLAAKICFERLGWRPMVAAKVLIFPDDGSTRRIVARYRETLDSVYPGRTRDVRRWLQHPSGPLSAIWFLPNVTLR